MDDTSRRASAGRFAKAAKDYWQLDRERAVNAASWTAPQWTEQLRAWENVISTQPSAASSSDSNVNADQRYAGIAPRNSAQLDRFVRRR